MTPLTHHDIVRVAAPLVRRGLRIDLDASDRAARRIAFHPLVRSDDETLHALHTLTVLGDGDVELVRAVAHAPSGLVSTLIACASDADALAEAFEAIPPSRQIVRADGVVAAFSRTLEPLDGRGSAGARDTLQQIVGHVGALCLIVDVSTGAGMPADVLLVDRDAWTDHLRDTLASGATVPQRQFAARRALATLSPDDAARRGDSRGTTLAPGGVATPVAAPPSPLPALPDDVLAVLGPEWRPLVWQGNRWKGVLRLLGREPERGPRAETRALAALEHLRAVLAEAPDRYHARHAGARRRVWVRRLRPAMALLAILAVMPLSWLFVARGGVQMHPLALGLTPLLMVGVVLLSAREIPVLEIPRWPRALPADGWSAASTSPGESPVRVDLPGPSGHDAAVTRAP